MKYVLQVTLPVLHTLVFCAAAIHLALVSPLGGILLSVLVLGFITLMIYDVLHVMDLSVRQLWIMLLWQIAVPILAITGVSGFRFTSVGTFLVETTVFLLAPALVFALGQSAVQLRKTKRLKGFDIWLIVPIAISFIYMLVWLFAQAHWTFSSMASVLPFIILCCVALTTAIGARFQYR